MMQDWVLSGDVLTVWETQTAQDDLRTCAGLLVLTISHSNAGEEWIFTMTTKNKTCFTPNPDPYETSGSMITIKLAMKENGVIKIALNKKPHW